MKTITIGVSTLQQTRLRMAAAFRGEEQGEFLSFASVELLWRTMTPRRWDIIRVLTGQAQMSLRAISRILTRDIKTIHGDVHALLDAGILKKTEDKKIIFPYDSIHVDFTITKAA
jgi:predicted transcriptional regulator